MAIEIIRPTNAVNNQSWTNPSNAWDNDTATSAAKVNPTTSDSIVFGGTGTGYGATNQWGTPAETWTAATVYTIFDRTAAGGDDDLVALEYGKMEGGSYTKIGDILASTSASVSKATRSIALSTSDFGTNFTNIANLRVTVFGDQVKGADGNTSNMYEVWVEGTYTPGVALIVPQTMVMN